VVLLQLLKDLLEHEGVDLDGLAQLVPLHALRNQRFEQLGVFLILLLGAPGVLGEGDDVLRLNDLVVVVIDFDRGLLFDKEGWFVQTLLGLFLSKSNFLDFVGRLDFDVVMSDVEVDLEFLRFWPVIGGLAFQHEFGVVKEA
jgi:hypothetical protein